MSNEEKRGRVRTPAKIPLRISHESFGTLTVTSQDISESGVLIEIGDAPLLLPGTSLDVQVMGLMSGPQEVQAEVVRIGDGGMGLRFSHELFDIEK